MLDDLYKETKDRMHKSVDSVKRELSSVRAGKASPHLLDSVKVQAYGTTMQLNQLATVSALEPRLLVVQAFDKGTVGEIVRGIQSAGLGLNPSAEGQVVRIPIPPLNEERRKELVKRCRDIAETGRVAIRNIRREANDKARKAQKDSDISEDQESDARDEIQKITDERIKEIDDLFVKKEAEVMEV